MGARKSGASRLKRPFDGGALPPVVFHLDVSREHGWGHFGECMTLADAFRARGIDTGFVLPTGVGSAEDRLRQGRYPFFAIPGSRWLKDSAQGLQDLFSAIRGRYVIADLIRLTPRYAARATRCVAALAVITEHREQELGDINFNICRFPKYMPIDAEFRGGTRRIPAHAERVLINYGGSDAKNCSGLTLEMLRQGFEREELPRTLVLTVVCGPLFPHRAALEALKQSYPVRLEVIGPLAPKQFARIARASDMAITTGGDTMYEFCATGLPSLVVPVLDKMAANAEVLARRRAIVQLPRIDAVTARSLVGHVQQLLKPAVRRRLARDARRTVDGAGAERIVARLIREWRLS